MSNNIEPKEKKNNIFVGFSVFDIVTLSRTWCVICATLRWMETYQEQTVCLACADVVENGQEVKLIPFTPVPGAVYGEIEIRRDI